MIHRLRANIVRMGGLVAGLAFGPGPARAQGPADAPPTQPGELGVARTATAVRLRIVDRRTGQPLPPHVLARTTVTARSLSPTATGASERVLNGYDGGPLWLDPGPWSVQVRPPGFRPVELRRSPLWGAGEETWDIAVVPEQIAVTLRVSPSRALRRATLRLTPTGGSPTPPIERPLDRAEQTIVLTGGPWQLDVTARRHEGHLPFFVTSSMPPVHLRLHRKPRPRGRAFERDDKLMAGVGMALFAQLTVGAGLALAGGVKHERAHDRNEALLLDALVDDATGDADGKPGLEQVEATYSTARYHGDIARGMNFEAAGVAVIMSGAAALIPAVTVASRARLRLGFIELGVGAAMLGGGAAWLATALHARNERLAHDHPTERVRQTDLRPLVGHNLGASILTGLGAGLTLFSAVALANDARKHRRSRMGAAPLAAPGLAGVLVRGRF